MAGFEHVVKSGLYLLRGAHAALLQVDADHFDTHFVTVQNHLHQSAHTRCNLIAFVRQRRVHFHFAHHFAHRSFGRLNHSFSGVFAFKQIGARIVQTVLDGKFDFHNVFVFGQHRRFTQARGFDHVVTPNVHRADLGHKHQLMSLHRIRQAPVETRAHRRLVFAELGDHRLLTFLDDEKPGAKPNQQGHRRNHTQTDAVHERRQARAARTGTTGTS